MIDFDIRALLYRRVAVMMMRFMIVVNKGKVYIIKTKSFQYYFPSSVLATWLAPIVVRNILYT